MYTFVGHDNWSRKMPEYNFESKYFGKVEILRPLLWFYVGQKNIKIEDLTKWFTDEAIGQLAHDKFIIVEVRLF